MKIECPKCHQQIKPQRGRSYQLEFILLVLGFPTVGLAWVILLIYSLFKPKFICPKCHKRISKKDIG